MKCVYATAFNGIDGLQIGELETPKANEGEVRVAVACTSVNPVDWKICRGIFAGKLPHKFPLIPGWDVAGVIDEVGRGVHNYKKGNLVFAYCRKPIIQWGTYAEYVVVDAKHAALKPKNFEMKESAAIPLVGLTTWQAFHDVAKLRSGETILIHAGAGGVGSFAIQLAKVIGAKVYTTCSRNNFEYVKRLGADVAIDYRNESFKDVILSYEGSGVDVVYDTIGGDDENDNYEVTKTGGRLVSIVAKPDKEKASQHHIKTSYVFVRPDGGQLQKIAKLIEEGKILPPNIIEMPLWSAVEALKKNSEGHTRGKIILRCAKD